MQSVQKRSDLLLVQLTAFVVILDQSIERIEVRSRRVQNVISQSTESTRQISHRPRGIGGQHGAGNPSFRPRIRLFVTRLAREYYLLCLVRRYSLSHAPRVQ